MNVDGMQEAVDERTTCSRRGAQRSQKGRKVSGFWIRAQRFEGDWIHWTGERWHEHPAYGKQVETRQIAAQMMADAFGALPCTVSLMEIASAEERRAEE